MLRFVVRCGLSEGLWDQGRYLVVGGSRVDSGIRSGKGVTPSLQVVLVITPILRECLPTEDHFGPQGTVALPGDIFNCHNWEGASGIEWVEARNAAKQHRTHRTALHGKELSSLKGQQCPN